ACPATQTRRWRDPGRTPGRQLGRPPPGVRVQTPGPSLPVPAPSLRLPKRRAVLEGLLLPDPRRAVGLGPRTRRRATGLRRETGEPAPGPGCRQGKTGPAPRLLLPATRANPAFLLQSEHGAGQLHPARQRAVGP